MHESSSDTLHMVADLTTAVAYYWLTYQLLAFAVNSKVHFDSWIHHVTFKSDPSYLHFH